MPNSGSADFLIYYEETCVLTDCCCSDRFLQIASAGDVTGKVTLKGTPPPEKTIAFDDTCSKLHPTVTTTRHYVVGKDNGLANVFVYISKGLEGKKFTAPTRPWS